MIQKLAICFLVFLTADAYASGEVLSRFLSALKQLDFQEAKRAAADVTDSELGIEMSQLADLVHYSGWRDKKHLNLAKADNTATALNIIRLLSGGYSSLFYDRVKGDAFKSFYQAHRLARELGNEDLTKATLLALLKYFKFEIAQNSSAHQPYLEEYKDIQSDLYDKVWIALYEALFYSKSLQELHSKYFERVEDLVIYQQSVPRTSPLLAHIYVERGLKADLENNVAEAQRLFLLALDHASGRHFLADERFLAIQRLLKLETAAGRVEQARRYLTLIRQEINPADSLRSLYYINLHSSFFYHAIAKHDSAFIMLRTAYAQDFQLDFRRNTLEINRLAVQLETQETENQNLRLQQSRLWLTIALGGVGGLLILSYLGYKHQRTRNRVMTKEKEVQSMKIEKLLKDQEVVGIDSMLEGQEKERQRLANELHDHVGSLLASIKMHFHHLRNEQSRQGSLEKADVLIEEAYQKIRSMAHVKNVGVIAQEGLVPAVRNFAQKASVLDTLTIDVVEHSMDKRLENSLEITLFRIIQELITNIIKHAKATEATIHFTQYDNSINIMVEDNGKGFDVTSIKPRQSMGLYSIQKRIENLGGDVTIESISGKGTSIIIDVPLI